jgi:catechol 2,3-dioxygenase-like lactoylglutathione lyase family enzyme
MRVHHVAIRVADVERSLAFYAGVLRLEVVARHPEGAGLRSAWLRMGAGLLMLERDLAGAGATTGSGHLLAFDVRATSLTAEAQEPLDEWTTRLARAGITLDGRTEHTLFCRDPDGHRVGLSTFPLAD